MKFRNVLLSVAVLSMIILIGASGVHADRAADAAGIRAAVAKTISPNKVTSFTSLAIKGDWAFARYTYTLRQTSQSRTDGALLRKGKGTWYTVSIAPISPTADFLEKYKVPEPVKISLLGKENINRNKSLLAFMRKNRPDCLFPSVRHGGVWALVFWTDTKTGAEGNALAKNVKGTWHLKGMDRGFYTRSTLINRFKVPEKDAALMAR